MKRVLCTVGGLALCTAAVVGFCYALYTLGRIGTCASGGPYVSARPCPSGTAETALLIPASIVGGLIGIAVYGAGGTFARKSAIGLPTLMWSFTFLGAAGSMAYAAWGPTADPDASTGTAGAAVILLVIFIPMGVIPLITALNSARLTRDVHRRAAARSAATGAPDVLTRLERLSGLRQSGAVTEEEFTRLKAQVLDGR